MHIIGEEDILVFFEEDKLLYEMIGKDLYKQRPGWDGLFEVGEIWQFDHGDRRINSIHIHTPIRSTKPREFKISLIPVKKSMKVYMVTFKSQNLSTKQLVESRNIEVSVDDQGNVYNNKTEEFIMTLTSDDYARIKQNADVIKLVPYSSGVFLKNSYKFI